MTSSSIKKTIAHVTAHCRDLEFIFTKVKKLQALNQCLANYLDPAIRDDCQLANVTDKCLILIVANGSVATQIRFMTADLLQKIKKNPLLNNIKTIQCKVRPSQSTLSSKQRPIKKIPKLSMISADIVRKIAESIKDPALQAVMRRIAEHKE